MKVLAVLVLVFWVFGSLVFWNWKRGVVYPSRSFAVGLTTALYEFSLIALAIWVLAS